MSVSVLSCSVVPSGDGMVEDVDPRDRRGRRYPLIALVRAAACAVATGAPLVRGDRTLAASGAPGRPDPPGISRPRLVGDPDGRVGGHPSADHRAPAPRRAGRAPAAGRRRLVAPDAPGRGRQECAGLAYPYPHRGSPASRHRSGRPGHRPAPHPRQDERDSLPARRARRTGHRGRLGQRGRAAHPDRDRAVPRRGQPTSCSP